MSALIEGMDIQANIVTVKAGVLFENQKMLVMGDSFGQVIIVEKMPVHKVKDSAKVKTVWGDVALVELILKSGIIGFCHRITVGFLAKKEQWFVGKTREDIPGPDIGSKGDV